MNDKLSRRNRYLDKVRVFFNFISIWLPFFYMILTILQMSTSLIKWVSTFILLSLTYYSTYILISYTEDLLKEDEEKSIEYGGSVRKYNLKYRWKNYITSLAQQNIDYSNYVKYLMDRGYKTFFQKTFMYCITIETLIISKNKIPKENLKYMLLFNLLMALSYAFGLFLLDKISKKKDEVDYKDYVSLSYTLLLNLIFPIIFLLFVFSLTEFGRNIKEFVIIFYATMLILIMLIVCPLFIVLKSVDKKKQTLNK